MTRLVRKPRRDSTCILCGAGETTLLQGNNEWWRQRAVAAPDGQRLADQRTVPAELSAAQQQSVPVGKRTALEIQKKVWPPERQYKANLPFTRLGRESARSEGGERVRYYLGVDWADQTHAVPHTAEGLREWAVERRG